LQRIICPLSENDPPLSLRQVVSRPVRCTLREHNTIVPEQPRFPTGCRGCFASKWLHSYRIQAAWHREPFTAPNAHEGLFRRYRASEVLERSRREREENLAPAGRCSYHLVAWQLKGKQAARVRFPGAVIGQTPTPGDGCLRGPPRLTAQVLLSRRKLAVSRHSAP